MIHPTRLMGLSLLSAALAWGCSEDSAVQSGQDYQTEEPSVQDAEQMEFLLFPRKGKLFDATCGLLDGECEPQIRLVGARQTLFSPIGTSWGKSVDFSYSSPDEPMRDEAGAEARLTADDLLEPWSLELFDEDLENDDLLAICELQAGELEALTRNGDIKLSSYDIDCSADSTDFVLEFSLRSVDLMTIAVHNECDPADFGDDVEAYFLNEVNFFHFEGAETVDVETHVLDRLSSNVWVDGSYTAGDSLRILPGMTELFHDAECKFVAP